MRLLRLLALSCALAVMSATDAGGEHKSIRWSPGPPANVAEAAWQAYELQRLKCEQHPDDADAKLATAEALMRFVRHVTNGNFPTASAGQVAAGDNANSRRIWRQYAPEALRLLRDVAKTGLPADDAKARHRYNSAQQLQQ